MAHNTTECVLCGEQAAYCGEENGLVTYVCGACGHVTHETPVDHIGPAIEREGDECPVCGADAFSPTWRANAPGAEGRELYRCTACQSHFDGRGLLLTFIKDERGLRWGGKRSPEHDLPRRILQAWGKSGVLVLGLWLRKDPSQQVSIVTAPLSGIAARYWKRPRHEGVKHLVVYQGSSAVTRQFRDGKEAHSFFEPDTRFALECRERWMTNVSFYF